MKDRTPKTVLARSRGWSALGLLGSMLMALSPAAHTADAPAPRNSASAPAANEVAPVKKATPTKNPKADQHSIINKVPPGPNPPGPKNKVKKRATGKATKAMKKPVKPVNAAPRN